ncbi:hypothetical protein ACJX0J_036197, partial [Zea mays]
MDIYMFFTMSTSTEHKNDSLLQMNIEAIKDRILVGLLLLFNLLPDYKGEDKSVTITSTLLVITHFFFFVVATYSKICEENGMFLFFTQFSYKCFYVQNMTNIVTIKHSTELSLELSYIDYNYKIYATVA